MTRSETQGIRDALLALGTATLYEASGLPCALPSGLSPVWPGALVVGSALPVATAAGDNLALHLAIEQARPGDVLVVDAQDAPHGYWGEVLTAFAQTRGVVGLVILGGVRDLRELEERRFPVFSTRVALTGTTKHDPGEIGGALRCGAAVVRRGDLVVADRDGVVAIPRDAVAAVLERSRARAAKEEDFIRRLEAGESTVDLYRFSRAGSGEPRSERGGAATADRSG